MTPYSDDFLDAMRQTLEARRAELVSHNHRARQKLRDRPDRTGDSIDESTDEQGTSTEMRLKDRESNLLNQVNKALEEITDGTYGLCVECEEPIGQARLEARPVARLCIDCKEEKEASQRRHHRKRPGLFR